MNFPEATKDNESDDKKTGPTHNQNSNRIVPNKTIFSLLTALVKDIFT